jgi:photosystem II stability/assembly factor-like uncharacterized protein
MRIKIIILMCVICCLGFAAWETNCPYSGNLRSVVVSYSNDNIVYVSSNSSPTSFAKTIDGGASWTTVGSIPTQAYCMAIDPTNDNKLYAGCGHSIYRSTNGGASWTSTSMSNKYIYGMVVHPSTPSTVFASGMSWNGSVWLMAFFKSTNSGANWTTTTFGTYQGNGYCIAVDRTNPNNVYVGGYYINSTYYPTIYKTTDGGTSFTQLTNGLPTSGYYFYSVAVHPTNSNIVYAGSYTAGIYRSTDGGANWAQASTHYYNYSMSTSPAAPDVAYAGGYSDIYKTTNAGVTWFSATTGMSGYYMYGVAMSPLSGTKAFNGDNAGFFKTTNGGSSWLNSTGNLSMAAILNFAVAPSAKSTVYTSLEEIGVFKTTNNGTNWTELPTPVTCGNICEFAVGYSDQNLLYALEGTG